MKHLERFENFSINEGLSAKQKKLPKALQDAILKKQGNKVDKKVEKEDKEEPRNGLTAKQKKLPKALQDAIIKKQK